MKANLCLFLLLTISAWEVVKGDGDKPNRFAMFDVLNSIDMSNSSCCIPKGQLNISLVNEEDNTRMIFADWEGKLCDQIQLLNGNSIDFQGTEMTDQQVNELYELNLKAQDPQGLVVTFSNYTLVPLKKDFFGLTIDLNFDYRNTVINRTTFQGDQCKVTLTMLSSSIYRISCAVLFAFIAVLAV